MTKISIIIPVYNAEHTLDKCLESLCNQTLKDIEIICINDKSSDNSLEKLLEYSNADCRIKVINLEKNVGAGVARNIALDAAKGDYILFVDADDWIDLNACEELYNQISAYNNDFIIFDLINYYEETQIEKHDEYRLKPFKEIIQNKNIILRDLNFCFFTTTEVAYKIYNREFLNRNNIRFSEQRFCEDDIFFIKAVYYSNSVSILDKALYHYRRHNSSACYKLQNVVDDIFKAKLECLHFLEDTKCTNLIELFIPYFINSLFYWQSKYKNTANESYFNDKLYRILNDIFSKYNIKESKETNIGKVKKWYKNQNSIFSKFFDYLLKLLSIKLSDDKTHLIVHILYLVIKIKISNVLYKRVNRNYKQVIEKNINKLKNKKHLRVLFLSNEISKWGYDSLYNLFAKSDYFDPMIVVYPLFRTHNKLDNTAPTLEHQYNFFKNKGYNVSYAYKDGIYMDIKQFNPDIVFYQQQWDLPSSYKPQTVSEYALTCYCSYSYEILNDKENYTKDFHVYLFRYYTEHSLNNDRYIKYNKLAKMNCIVVGYPKLDQYNNEINREKKYWKDSNKIKIIYAPHHSFEEDGLKLATFRKNGKFILDLAKKHLNTTWVFKPHPRFKWALKCNNIMTDEEIDNYYKSWEEIGNIYDTGDYIDLFKSSDIMVTDCCSFLAEYFPSKNPLLRLINKNSVKLNKLGEKICSCYYNVNSNNELDYIFNKLIKEKLDNKKDKRLKLLSTIFFDNNASDKIFNDLCKILKIQSNRG